MSTKQEIKRIEAVYQTYHNNQTIKNQWSGDNPGNRAIANERDRVLKQKLQTAGFLPLTKRYILDIGCGEGNILANLKGWGATSEQLYGVDLLPYRIITAKEKYPELSFQQSNAEQLNFKNETFDLIILYAVFTSILDKQLTHNIAEEIKRILKPGGAVIWYDFRYNNPNNPNVRGITKNRVQTIFPDFKLQLQTATLLPPLARRLGIFTPLLYPILINIPLLRTHYLGLLTKPN